MTEINHGLAEVILDKIRSYPETFNMANWCSVGDSYAGDPTVDCGTTLCVAGWVDLLTRGVMSTRNIDVRALEALGLSRRCRGLFFMDDDVAIEALEVMAKPDSTEDDVLEVLYRLAPSVAAEEEDPI